VDTGNGILYFTSKRNSVQTKFAMPQSLDKLLEEMNRYENGLSRLYKVQLGPLKP